MPNFSICPPHPRRVQRQVKLLQQRRQQAPEQRQRRDYPVVTALLLLLIAAAATTTTIGGSIGPRDASAFSSLAAPIMTRTRSSTMITTTTTAFAPNPTALSTTIRGRSSRPFLALSSDNNNNNHQQAPKATPKRTKGAKPPAPAEFEYQELRAQMQGMQRAGVASTDLTAAQHVDLESYVQAIVQKRRNNNSNNNNSLSLRDLAQHLPQTTWRLSYSTPGFASASGLPRQATLYVEFVNAQQAYYRLQFDKGQVFGLNNIQAKCSWSVGTDEAISADPTQAAGVVTLQYESITTDAFGFSNLNVGLFGMLKGRSTYIQTLYFDNLLWIEQGYTPEGEIYYNVYTRQDDDKDTF
ncbi:hypothetical protein ACA910_005404 [Epithemia clementina (nom. ined.)]